MSKTSHTVEKVKVSDMLVDRRVQRDDLNDKKVRDIEADFNEDALGVVTLSRRKDKGLYIVDGWHRQEAAKRKNSDYELNSHVFEGLTLVQEAEMFLALNNRTPVSMLEKYKVRLSAEDPDALTIEKITTSRGWKIDDQVAPGHIQAIGAVYRIHEASKKIEAEPHLLDATLMIITRAWGNDRDAAQAVILEGIARVLAKHTNSSRTPVNVVTMFEKLRDRKGGPKRLHTEAAQLAQTRHGRVTNAVSELVVEAYNKGARNRALPVWTQRT